ncbi:MAG TPA: sterol desaturase family protein [Thermodesulfobacteriota bacterium]|nr:sterol desaturase family protein [Thermodesulfobacteriota bacterium]
MSNASLAITRALLFWGGLLFFLGFELIIPYRPSSVSKLKRWLNNIGLGVFNSVVLNLLFASAILKTIEYVSVQKMGLFNQWSPPFWVKILGTVIVFDFFLYIWHLLNHVMPLFWRFHRVHHSDLNMDVSTASRFHIGELALSAIIRIGLIFFLGADLFGVALFESLIVLTSQFHHSSLTVPFWFERFYWILFVPPSMHRIHHSVVINERNTNYGTILSLWDRLLGTLLMDVNQGRILIGMGAYRKPDSLNFHHLIFMPFTRSVR